MIATNDFSAYSTILFIDSMIALECKPLPTLPWQEIDPSGPILILVVPQVNKEIDKRKRDGRLGKRAREFNRLIAPAAESTKPVCIVSGPPHVDIAVAVTNKIDWDLLDDLDPDEGDARIVAQILNARDVLADRRLLFSHDINPIAMASRHNLKSRKMPDHWLLEPEPSPNEKELLKLKTRVGQLEANEPDIRFSVEYTVDASLTIYKVQPFSQTQQKEIIDRIIRQNPEINQGMISVIGYDSSYSGKYEKYCAKSVPQYAARINRHLETFYNQIPFTLKVENAGHIQAENLAIVLEAVDGRLHSRFACHALFGPTPPRPEPYSIAALNMGNSNLLSQFNKKSVGRHEMEFTLGPDRGKKIEIQCQDFRQGRAWAFEGIAQIDPDSGSPFKIRATVTASNQRGLKTTEYELAFTSRTVGPNELIDIEGRQWRISIPMKQQFDGAIEGGDVSWLEFVGDNEDIE